MLSTKIDALLHVLSDPNALVLGVISSTMSLLSLLFLFTFALLSLYFIIEKDKPKALLAIVFMVFSFKRIAFVGFLSSLMVYYLLNRSTVKYNRRLFTIVITSFNFIYLWGLIFLVNGYFDQFISDIFGVSSNFLFMGRVDMYSNIFSKLGQSNLFGIGIGRVSDYLSNYVESGIGEGILTNIHSDILKYYLELGVIGFMYSLYIILHIGYLTMLLTYAFVVMLNVIFLTDNVSIYFGFMILFFIINYKMAYTNKFSKTSHIVKPHDFDLRLSIRIIKI